jgi:integrase
MLIEGWAGERQPAAKTLYSWRRTLDQLAAFVGHRDASRLKVENIIAWKAQLIADGLNPKTVRDGKLAPVRAVLRWGRDNLHLPEDVSERVNIEVRTRLSQRKRSFTYEEARLLLRAAEAEADPVRRWIPILCAYSGARVSEICQLHAEDVLRVEDHWCMRMAAEAGSLKNIGSERVVPLHPALLKSDFLRFVQSIGSGPLFKSLTPDRFGSRGGNGTKVLSRWIRGLGLTDLRLSPNHSWRHRLKTLARRHGLDTSIIDAVTGHSRRTVSDTYGEFPVEALARELSKIPTLDLEQPDGD